MPTLPQKTAYSSSGVFSQILGSNTVYTFNQSLTTQAIEDKGLGNSMKKGSGGNSYDAYIANKKGSLIQYCDCGNN